MTNSMYFVLACVALVAGYAIYGSFVARVFGADARRSVPAQTMADGVDYVEMPTLKVWLIDQVAANP